jgi:hypothetical protein
MKYSLPVILEMLDSLSKKNIFIALGLQNVCHHSHNLNQSSYQTACHVELSQFNYGDVPLHLINVQTTIHDYVVQLLHPNINNIPVYGIDNILLLLTDNNEHQ